MFETIGSLAKLADVTPDLQFNWSPEQPDHGAAIFVEPWLKERRGPLGGEMVGRVRCARTATFKVLTFAKAGSQTHFQVRVLKGHDDGAVVGWLPHWQVTIYRPDAARDTYVAPQHWVMRGT